MRTRVVRRAIVVFMIMVLLGGIGWRNTSANVGAIAGGAVALVAGAGVTYGGCVAMRAAVRPDAQPPIQPAIPPETAP